MENKDLLLKKKKELEKRIQDIKKDFRRGLDRNLDEQAIQLENADVLNALLTQAENELVEINEKLRKLT